MFIPPPVVESPEVPLLEVGEGLFIPSPVVEPPVPLTELELGEGLFIPAVVPVDSLPREQVETSVKVPSQLDSEVASPPFVQTASIQLFLFHS